MGLVVAWPWHARGPGRYRVLERPSHGHGRWKVGNTLVGFAGPSNVLWPYDSLIGSDQGSPFYWFRSKGFVRRVL